MIRKKTVFFLLVLILGTVLPAAEAATPVQPLPDGKIVIVVKDYELLKNTAAPPTGDASPGNGATGERHPAGIHPTEWWNGVRAWGAQVRQWFADQAGELLFLAIGIGVTLLIAAGITFLTRRIFTLRWKHMPYTTLRQRLYEVFHRPTFWFLCSIGIFLSAQPLLRELPPVWFTVWLRLLFAALAVCVFWGVFRLISLFDDVLKARALLDPSRHMDTLLIDLIRKTVKVVVTVIAVFFVAQNIFELNITSLLAGAGVVGLAIAFAAQETIANVFGSIMIILDKPFAVGERVKIGAIDGSVESVGLRSTEVRSLDGNLFSVPNRQVADGVIENISRRPNIKYPFSIALTYDTPPEKMEEACKILHDILDSHPGFDTARQPPLVFFTDYKDWSLNISVIVWFNTRDFLLSQKWKHEINLEILRRFNAAKLKFARPANTTFLAGDPDYPPVSGSVPVSGR